MNYTIRRFALFILSVLICLNLFSFAADQPTVLVVAQDGAQLFYHRNGTPTDMEIVPKGTEFTIESTSGERCFVTYKGKPAYIRREFLVTKQELLEGQAAIGRQQTTNTVSELPTTMHGQAVPAGPIGYAWPKSIILITNTAPSSFKQLKNGGTYPLLVSLESGYSIICEGADGQKRAAFLPMKDRFGNPLTVYVNDGKVTVNSSFCIMDTLDDYVRLKPGVVPMHYGQKYAVLDRSEGSLSIQFTSAELTQTVSVAEADVRFLTLTDYNKAVEAAIQDLKSKADKAIESGDFEAVSDIFKLYQGECADDTVDVRDKLAKEYAGRAQAAIQAVIDAKQKEQLAEIEKFDAGQRAKGLVQYYGQWMTTNEVPQAETRRQEWQVRQEEQARLAPEREPLSKLTVSCEWQDVWMNGGKKLVVRVKNNSQFTFSGDVDITGKSYRDETVDWDSIFFTDEHAIPGYSERAALLWFKNPEFINALEYKVNGSFR